MNNLSLHFVDIPYTFDLELRSHITAISGDSGSGKSLWLRRLPDITGKRNLTRSVYYNHIELLKSAEDGEQITFSRNKATIIIIDNADLFFKLYAEIDQESCTKLKWDIAHDFEHWYILVGRDIPLGIHPQQMVEFSFLDKKCSLHYIMDNLRRHRNAK